MKPCRSEERCAIGKNNNLNLITFDLMVFKRDSLLYSYRWADTPEGDSRLRGDPDSSVFERGEGHEVLYLINSLMASKKLQSAAVERKIETMIQHHPSNLQSQLQVKTWIMEHWDRY